MWKRLHSGEEEEVKKKGQGQVEPVKHKFRATKSFLRETLVKRLQSNTKDVNHWLLCRVNAKHTHLHWAIRYIQVFSTVRSPLLCLLNTYRFVYVAFTLLKKGPNFTVSSPTLQRHTHTHTHTHKATVEKRPKLHCIISYSAEAHTHTHTHKARARRANERWLSDSGNEVTVAGIKSVKLMATGLGLCVCVCVCVTSPSLFPSLAYSL